MRSTRHETAGSALRKARKTMGLSQRALGRLAHANNTTLSHYEGGSRVIPEPAAATLDAVLRDALPYPGKLVELARIDRDRRTPPTLRPTRQLPALLQPLIGRDTELARATQALQHARQRGQTPILAVTGPAGSGKSLFTNFLAQRQQHEYGGNTLVAHLQSHSGQPADPGEIVARMLVALGVEDVPTRTDTRAQLLRTLLEHQPSLLLLDDAKTTEQIVPLLPADGAESAVVINSRHRLNGIDELHRIELSPLDDKNAAGLLQRRLRAGDEYDWETLTRLAGLCDRLPLAIQLLASYVNAHPQSLSTVEKALRGPGRQRLLNAGAGAGIELPSLTSTFESSLTCLSREATELLTVLAHATDHEHIGIGHPVLRDYANADSLITELVGENVLVPTHGGWKLSTLLRDYLRTLARNATIQEIERVLGGHHNLDALEQRVQEHRRGLHDVQREARLGMWQWDPRTGENWLNPALYELCARPLGSPTSFDGYLWQIPDGQRTAVAEQWQRARGARQPLEVVHEYRRQDGDVVILHLWGRATTDPWGHELVTGTAQDISDRPDARDRVIAA